MEMDGWKYSNVFSSQQHMYDQMFLLLKRPKLAVEKTEDHLSFFMINANSLASFPFSNYYSL